MMAAIKSDADNDIHFVGSRVNVWIDVEPNTN